MSCVSRKRFENFVYFQNEMQYYMYFNILQTTTKGPNYLPNLLQLHVLKKRSEKSNL